MAICDPERLHCPISTLLQVLGHLDLSFLTRLVAMFMLVAGWRRSLCLDTITHTMPKLAGIVSFAPTPVCMRYL
jgi:hypothetical protein